jgi:hypothetical protein
MGGRPVGSVDLPSTSAREEKQFGFHCSFRFVHDGARADSQVCFTLDQLDIQLR